MSSTTEAPFSVLENGSKSSGGNLENGAVGLDVPVRIHGSQVAAVVLDATEHVEPFEEDTSTMIVFSHGAVVKLHAQVRTGHTVILTNLQSMQTVPCRIVQVNAANSAHYIKLEFSEPSPGFWDVHSHSNSSAPSASAKEPTSQHSEAKKLTPASTVAQIPMQESSSAVRSQVDETSPAKLPATPRDAMQLADSSEKTSASKYEPIRETPSEIVPLAAGPVKSASHAPKPKSLTTNPELKPASRANTGSRTTASPIFDSLSTDEDIFGTDKSTASASDSSALNRPRDREVTLRSLDEPVLSRPRSRNSHGRMLAVFATVIALAAAGGWYFRQQLKSAFQNATRTVVERNAPAQQATAEALASKVQNPAPTPIEENVVTSPAQSVQQSPDSKSPAASDAAQPEESTITVTPVHVKSDGSAISSAPAPDAASSNIYAGNLNARPKSDSRKLRIAAPMPKINMSAPSTLAGSPAAQLNPLMSGATAGLPAPPAPEAAPISGGKLIQPKLIRSVPPSYPAIANANRVQGDVQIQATIDENGKVTAAKVISGPSLLRNAAITAVRQWRYSPATLDGKTISMQYVVTVRFRLGQ